MANEKITGVAVLDSCINKLNKNFGKVLISNKPKIYDIPSIPTGSLNLDISLGYGGFPQGKIIEIFGPEAAGKTSLGLAVAKKAQDLFKDKFLLIMDMEYSMNTTFIESFGIDMDRLVFAQTDNAEQALQTVMDLTKTGEICAILFDSIDACQPQAMLDKDLGDANVGGISKLTARFFREYSKVCSKVNCMAIFINQEKDTLAMYGAKKTTPGGSALKYYSALRIKNSSIKPSSITANAYINTSKIVKNKGAPRPDKDIIFDFIYGKGPDPFVDTINAAKDMGVLFFQGKGTKLKEDGNFVQVCSNGGIAGFLELIKTDDALFERVRKACYSTLATNLAGTSYEIPEEPEEIPEEVLSLINEESGDKNA